VLKQLLARQHSKSIITVLNQDQNNKDFSATPRRQSFHGRKLVDCPAGPQLTQLTARLKIIQVTVRKSC